MTQEYIKNEMAKAGLKSFKQYLWILCNVSFDTFTNWTKEEQEELLNDFFSS